MQGNRPVPTSSESAYHVRELFFSITDPRGIIEVGNSVFRRVAKYSSSELIGSPHNIIRHPDMPKAVFKLLWDTIQSGRRIAAYVKNLAKDGSYYWVLATVFPVPGGYLSIRVKPTSGVLPTIEALYREMLEAEKKSGIPAAVEVLNRALASLGFGSYEAFMASSLFAELQRRKDAIAAEGPLAASAEKARFPAGFKAVAESCETLTATLDTLFLKLKYFTAVKAQFQAKARSIHDLAKETGLLSMNVIMEAARLHDAGRALAVVAQHMKDTSDENVAGIKEAERSIAEVMKTLDFAIFDIAASSLQAEMALFFLEELAGESVSTEASASIRKILGLVADQTDQATRHMVEIGNGGLKLKAKLAEVEESIRAMGIIQFSGLVETARLEGESGFKNIFERVRKFSSGTEPELRALLEMIRTMAEETQEIPAICRVTRALVTQIEAALCR